MTNSTSSTGSRARRGHEAARELLFGERGAVEDDARAKVVMARKGADVADHVEARRRDE